MGIKQLNNLLRSKCPEVFQEIHLSEFAYQKVSIDVSLYLCKFKSLSDSWLGSFTKLISCLRKHNVHCVFIFDNGHPEEKTKEREERRNNREKNRVRIEMWESWLEKFEKGEEEWNTCLDELIGSGSAALTIVEKKREVKHILEKKRRSLLSIVDEDFIKLRLLFDAMKVSYYDAPLEAETMCADLCKRGIVAAAMSDDTDVLAYGSPVFLTKVDIYRGTATKILYKDMLEKLKLGSSSQFLDLCIMCGTDYNKNIAKVGCETSYKYILQYGDIETIGQSKGLDLTVLNYKKSRELFTVYEQYDFGGKDIPFNGFPDIEKIKNILAEEKETLNLFDVIQCCSKVKIFFS